MGVSSHYEHINNPYINHHPPKRVVSARHIHLLLPIPPRLQLSFLHPQSHAQHQAIFVLCLSIAKLFLPSHPWPNQQAHS